MTMKTIARPARQPEKNGAAEMASQLNAEEQRLRDGHRRVANWQRFGPYLAERQWATVREDYSAHGNCWDYFPHDHARSRAYRWGEDGLLGICDRECRLCFGLALWNGNDPILKERLFGLTGPEGNHGEDVKECYYYLDSTPTHSYMKALYKYPQRAFPYDLLVEENRRRGKLDPEFELLDTGVFDDNRYFDVFAEYAKASPNDILIRITVANRGPDDATLHLLPTLWFRNTWAWGPLPEGDVARPLLERSGPMAVTARHDTLGTFDFRAEAASGAAPLLLFTDNETNAQRLFNFPNETAHVKDAFHDYVIDGDADAVNSGGTGTKAAAHYVLQVPAGKEVVLRLRLSEALDAPAENAGVGDDFDKVFADRLREADEFFLDHGAHVEPDSDAARDEYAIKNSQVRRQAFAGLLWSKQFYHYVVRRWLHGDPDQPAPPEERLHGRNHDWPHVYNRDVISMPDKWEYPWYAAWDLAFHMIPMAKVDPEFAKDQLKLFLREWYMHPNGQIPAYEFAFSDVNPPVHAWACWRVYKMTGKRGARDRQFLATVFSKLLINFTWWVNRKDVAGNHLFSGGFLGLDNIGVFDRSKPIPGAGFLEQADGTAWMAFYCGSMLSMALELALEDPTYEDIACKFFEHFVHIADAMNSLGGMGLWNEADGFYYDQLKCGSNSTPLEIRSIVGVIPLFAVELLEEDTIDRLPEFRKRMEWFLNHRPDLARHISYCECATHDPEHEHNGQPHRHRILAIPSRERLTRVLRYVLDESEFLAPNGVRALSRYHLQQPYAFHADGQELKVEYDPAESTSGLFGGNSNWRGPIWFPVNFLLIEALERYHHFYEDSLQVECPAGSGNMMSLQQVADELSRRLRSLFVPADDSRRPCHGKERRYADDPHWRDLVLFYEYFHGDTGRGVGASHQTGWTALVAAL